MKNQVELFHAFTIDEVHDRRELFGILDPADHSSNINDLCDWILGFPRAV